MKIRLFPDGGIHSAYLDLVRSPPNGVEFVGKFRYDTATNIRIKYRTEITRFLDRYNLPYLVPFASEYPIHSCQKLLLTNANYVIDTEHGNPFMGENNMFKNEHPQFRYLVEHVLHFGNCKYIMPWTYAAEVAFKRNFSFLGKDFLDEKVVVVHPSVSLSKSNEKKFDKFTFIFIGGVSFHEKGGVAVLEAFRRLTDDVNCNLLVVGEVPATIAAEYGSVRGVHIWKRLPREEMLKVISKSHCVVLPSYADTYGMVLLEAKSFGVPAIVVDNFAAKEIVTHKKTGFVIPHDTDMPVRFDRYGCKILGRDVFLSMLKSYEASERHINDLVYAMKYMIGASADMEQDCIDEVKIGRFSILERNRILEGIYGSLGA